MRRLARFLLNSGWVFSVGANLDQVLVILAALVARARNRDAVGLGFIAAPGDGNIGDHAMAQSIIANFDGERVVVISELPHVYDYLQNHRVEVLVLPNLLGARGPARWRDMLRLAKVIATLRHFGVVGADMMDGGYGRVGAYRRWSTLNAVAAVGRSAILFGSSWNGAPDRLVEKLARQASRRGVFCMLRDPISTARAHQSGLMNVVECRDVVFAHPYRTRFVSEPERLAVVNASGLIARHTDLTADYVTLVSGLLDRAYSVLLVPHVLEPNSTDLGPISLIAEAFNSNEPVVVASQPMTPSDVAETAASAAVVITGRMHLSILALAAGTPAVVLATQGKVEGLMQSVGLPEGCLQPEVGVSEAILHVVDQYDHEGTELRSRLLHEADLARRLAQRNFVWK